MRPPVHLSHLPTWRGLPVPYINRVGAGEREDQWSIRFDRVLGEVAAFMADEPFVDYWWLVVADRAMVKGDELPKGWGLMAPRNGELVVVRPARRREAQPMPRTRIAALLRAVAKTAQSQGGTS
jgi:hypothetical protein